MKWVRTATGGWLSADGNWHIRGPIMGKPMFWLYGPSDRNGVKPRYTATGKYDDVVHFQTAREAKTFVERLKAK